MAWLEHALYPFTFILGWLLEHLHTLSGHWGLSIIILSTLVHVISRPIARRAQSAEQREQAVQAKMAPAMADIKQRYQGRERFEATEALYKKHGYHPIHSMASLLPLLLQLPLLLAALFLLTGHEALKGESFLFISDLGSSDGLLPIGSNLSVNLLPIGLTLIALTEAMIKQGATNASRTKFAVVSVVVALLIYSLPSAVCLYWLTNNLWSLLATCRQNVTARRVPAAPGSE